MKTIRLLQKKKTNILFTCCFKSHLQPYCIVLFWKRKREMQWSHLLWVFNSRKVSCPHLSPFVLQVLTNLNACSYNVCTLCCSYTFEHWTLKVWQAYMTNSWLLLLGSFTFFVSGCEDVSVIENTAAWAGCQGLDCLKGQRGGILGSQTGLQNVQILNWHFTSDLTYFICVHMSL